MAQVKGANGCGSKIPPSLTHVEIYFLEKGRDVAEATRFYNHHHVNNWKYVRDWKAAAFNWLIKGG